MSVSSKTGDAKHHIAVLTVAMATSKGARRQWTRQEVLKRGDTLPFAPRMAVGPILCAAALTAFEAVGCCQAHSNCNACT